jgi:ATP-binding cassette subfamily B protein
VLDGIDIEARPGEQIAVVGPSGIGKSTIVSLLLRLYDPQAGAVTIDGQDIRRFTLSSLRSRISVVMQDGVLFAASVRENICYGSFACSETVTPEQVEAAAKLASAHEFILALPQGYDTVIGERGVTLSGGQRQRIALARAAVRSAPIMVFDEPTTGLDEENERTVLEALQRVARGRTTFYITHDLRLASRADQILYIEGGRVIERGTHAQLMAASARYAALYVLQTAGAPPESPAATGAGRRQTDDGPEASHALAS